MAEESLQSRKSLEMLVSYSAKPKRGTSVSDDDDEKKEVGVEDESSGFSGDNEDEVKFIPVPEVDNDGVVREYEVALKILGFGFFHILLQVINGVALSSDAVEILSISFVFPVLSRKDEWGIGSTEEALLGSTIFLGMLFGSFVWGSLADMIGRRTTIVIALLVSAIFGFLSAFLPWFWIFALFRFLSGFGVGGSLPVIFPYTSEFIRNKYRGPYLGVQAFFWMLGQLICGALAWAIIPIRQFHMFGRELDSWRVFIAICALPSLIGAVMYFFLPESPRFLLQVGKQQEALKALRLAYKLNHLRKHTTYPVKFILLDGVASDSISSNLRECNWKIAGVRCKEMFLRNIDLFQLKFLRQTILILIIMFCLSFGSYGLNLWYPTYVDELTAKKDSDNLQAFCNKTTSSSLEDNMKSYCDCTSTVFQDTSFSLPELKDWRINNVLFRNVTFLNVTFDSVLFNGTEFTECKFQNCTFTRLLFNATVFNDVQFQSVNILATSLCLFSNTSEGAVTLENVTINSKRFESQNFNISTLWTILESEVNSTCRDDHYDNIICKSNDFRVYRDVFLVAVSGLPGNIASAIAVYFLRRNYWLAFSMFASSVSVFLLYIATSEAFVVAMLCLFNAVSTPSWNDTSLIIAELYPTHLRTTAAGLHLLMARIGAIIGTNIFGLFVKVNPSIPILLIASLFFVGVVCSLGVPKTTRKTLLK